MERILTLPNVGSLMCWAFTGACTISKNPPVPMERTESSGHGQDCVHFCSSCVDFSVGWEHLQADIVFPTVFPRNCCFLRCACVSTSSACLRARWINFRMFHSRSFDGLVRWGKESDGEPLPPAHLYSAEGGCPEPHLPCSAKQFGLLDRSMCMKTNFCSINCFVFQI